MGLFGAVAGFGFIFQGCLRNSKLLFQHTLIASRNRSAFILSGVIAELEFCNVERKIFLAELVERTDDAPLNLGATMRFPFQLEEEAMTSNEMFAMVGGKKTDAALHKPILDNKAADEALANERAIRLKKKGFTAAQIVALFG